MAEIRTSRFEGLGFQGTLLRSPNREPQEYNRNLTGIYLPGSSYSIIFLLHSWGSLFGVPIRNHLGLGLCQDHSSEVSRFLL